jgi:hypothetical protein
VENGLDYVRRVRGMPKTKEGIELAYMKSLRSARDFLGGTAIRDLMNHR